jgi:hypothetical protein
MSRLVAIIFMSLSISAHAATDVIQNYWYGSGTTFYRYQIVTNATGGGGGGSGKGVPILTNSLNLWLGFTSDTGTNYTDASPSNMFCTTIAQPTWSTNFGGMVSFTNSQRIKLGPPGSFASAPAEGLTMAFWYRQYASLSSVPMSFYDPGLGNSFGKLIYTIAGAGPYFQLRKQNASNGDAPVAAQQLNKWILCVATYTNNIRMTVYTNAVVGATADWTATGTVLTTNQCLLGNDVTGTYPYTGDIGFCAYWHRGLTAEEVTNLFEYTKSSFGY